jgi:hypothetical protein
MAFLRLSAPRLFAAFFAIAWLCPAVLLAQGRQIADGGGSCEMHPLVALKLDFSESGYLLVPVKFNETQVFMYLEIGAPFSVISQQAANRFKLIETEIGKVVEITRGTRRLQRYADTDFTLGDFAYRQGHFFIDPQFDTTGRHMRPEVIGILGMDLLWKMDLDLDLAHGRLDLYEHAACRNQILTAAGHYHVVPLQRDAFGNIFFPMELDGKNSRRC